LNEYYIFFQNCETPLTFFLLHLHILINSTFKIITFNVLNITSNKNALESVSAKQLSYNTYVFSQGEAIYEMCFTTK